MSENNRVGIAFSESMDETSLLKTVDMARENAQSSDENEYEQIEGIATEFIEEENKK